MRLLHTSLVVSLLLGLASSNLNADEEGQPKLDQAIEKQLEAKTPADLKEVVTLAEEAIKEGLDEANESFAKELVSTTLVDFSTQLAKALLARPAFNNPQWQKLHKEALSYLDKAVEYGAESGEAFLLQARLNILPGGDERKAREAADRAVKAFEDEPKQRASALVMRAGLSQDKAKLLGDLNAAIEAYPEGNEALQLRGLHYVQEREFEKGIADLTKVLERNGENLGAMQTLVQAFVNLGKFDKAEKQLTRLIEQQPNSPLGFRMRAGLKAQQGKDEEAIKDLTKALEVAPNDLPSLLLRSQIHLENEDYQKAKEDVETLLQMRPGLIAAIEQRVQIAAGEERLTDAISDLKLLIQSKPDSIQYRLQLGLLFAQDKRPRKAIEQYTKVLQLNKENWRVIRLRGDAYLGIGEHKKAIEDFDRALELAPDDGPLLNNLAWVLATSPDEQVRNGERAVELGKRACEATEFKKPHILSTYAAGFAEIGDFENAKKWSSKAVELGQEEIDTTVDAETKKALEEQLKQLKGELEKYEQGEPWRERQEVEENTEPLKDEAVGADT